MAIERRMGGKLAAWIWLLTEHGMTVPVAEGARVRRHMA